MKNNDKKIALFCGAYRLPFLVLDELRARGWEVFVIGLRGFYDAALKPDMVIRLGGGGAAARECKKRGIEKLCFVGAIGHPNLSDIRPDLWSVSILAKIIANQKGYDSMARALIAGIESKGFKIVGAQDYCPDLVFQPGIQTKTKPTTADKKIIDRAVHVSQIMGREDIGSSVVVDKQVLAVEAAEGTANMFKRVIEIRGGRKGSGVFAKMVKPGQDVRIDTTAIGVDTIKSVAAAGLRGIIVDAKQCFVIDRIDVIAAADKNKIFIVAK
ncbi:MAG: UDP-2,3-diacylglucosamine diphosphatase LpxI [Alphaproteobacteria bacterium]|nr:UDP-2,3-diacylglucosamine diphosphatase LpxI [Alphaproteobacteria bacterium]MCL2889756.1 UDP-2,3-diacylglucosamine diphosphatase LpxI [Alphaproteobacteria bacterium]